MDTKPIAKPIAGADEHIKFLLEEVWSLDSKWHLYQALFVDSASIVELNRRTGFVFHFFQRTLWNDIILQIGKLLDNASYTKSKLTRWNVCFATMLRHVPAAELDAMTRELDDFRASLFYCLKSAKCTALCTVRRGTDGQGTRQECTLSMRSSWRV
jgi:hypothetical protein